MLNIESIDTTIEYYENQDTTLENCKILADLYTCRANYKGNRENTTNLVDAYDVYTNSKKEFQLNNTDSTALLNNLDSVLMNLESFIETLYKGTDIQDERDKILCFTQKLEKTTLHINNYVV